MRRTFRRMFALLLCMALLTGSVGLADEQESGTVEAGSADAQVQADPAPAGDASDSGAEGAVTEALPSTDEGGQEGGVTEAAGESEGVNDSETVETAPDSGKPDADSGDTDPEVPPEVRPEDTENATVPEDSESATAPEAGGGETDLGFQSDGGANAAAEEQGLESVAVAAAAFDVAPEECQHPRDAWRRLYDDAGMADYSCDSATPYNDRGHMASGKIYDRFICGACGEDLGWQQSGTYSGRFESHSFENGVCRYCKYSNACTHPLEQLTVVYEYDQIAPDSIQDNGESGHTATREHIVAKRCNYCGLTLPEEVVETADASGPHEYNSKGVCKVCEHEDAGKICGHPADMREAEWSYTGRRVLDSDETGHLIMKRDVTCYICGACGEYIEESGEEYGSEKEAHDFGVDVCRICHYENPCKHPAESVEIVKDGDDLIDGMTEAVDGLNHLSVYYPRVHKRCGQCGYEWDYVTDYAAEPTRVAERHRWSDRGTCRFCGYVNRCAHPEDQWELEYIDQEREVVEPLNERGHMTSWRNYGYFTCAACGLDLGKKPLELEAAQFESHEFRDGVCRYCEYKNECEHPAEKVRTNEWDSVLEVLSRDESGHVAMGYHYIEKYCAKCGEYLVSGPTTEEPVEIRSPHRFYEGYCEVCGFENTCAHPEASRQDVYTYEDSGEVVSSDESGHTVMMCEVTQFTCGVCGEYVTLRGESYGPETRPHEFGLTECEICGYANPCKHPEESVEIVERYDSRVDGMTEAIDGLTHMSVYYLETHKHCKLCDYEWDYETHYEEEPIRKPEHHHWSEDGTCWVCGYVNRCAHDFKLEMVYPSTTSVVSSNAYGHVTIEETMRTYRCAICGYQIERNGGESYRVASGHSFDPFGGDGSVCNVCGYRCAHPAKYREIYDHYANALSVEVIAQSAEEHTVRAKYQTHIREVECLLCGGWLHEEEALAEPVEKTETYVHNWVYDDPRDGVYCIECGMKYPEQHEGEPHWWLRDEDTGEAFCLYCGEVNTCPHDETVVAEGEWINNSVIDATRITAKTHSYLEWVVSEKYCAKCGMELGYEVAETPRLSTSNHSFRRVGDVMICSFCRYVKPVAQPGGDAAPAAVDEPKFTDVPADEVVHGVAAADGLRMGTALAKVMEGIEADYGPDAEIAVQNADKLLTEQEQRSLQALEPVERVLVMLTVLGYEEEAQNALSELGIELSDGAKQLIEAVFSRTEAMTDEEFAAFRALIAEFFPEMTRDGSGMQEITLEIHTGDGARWERYGFTRTDEGWVFTKLATMTA